MKPRGKCPDCGKEVAICADGTVNSHQPPYGMNTCVGARYNVAGRGKSKATAIPLETFTEETDDFKDLD